MNRTDAARYLKALCRTLLKWLLTYALFPSLCLVCLAGPIGEAVRGSGAAVFLMPLGALGAVSLNWPVYMRLRGRRPTLLVLAHGACCLLALVIVEYEALPRNHELTPTLAVIAGCLTLVSLFLASYWLAPRPSRAARVTAVGLWIVIGLLAFFMLYRVIRDIESRNTTPDTWITLGVLAVLVPASFAHRIRRAVRRRTARRRATGFAEGRIVQLVGETRLDLDDDLVTDYYARVQYTVDEADYETRADIDRLAMRWFGKKAFIGKTVPVYYDPTEPGKAFVMRLDRRLFQ